MTQEINKITKRRRVPQKLEGRLQLFELKQMADMKAAYKSQCLRAIKTYKDWLKQYREETDIIVLLYGTLEGTMLRHQAQDAAKLYWTIRQDFRRSFKEYIERSCCYPSSPNTSKKAA